MIDDSRNPLAGQEVSWSAAGGVLQDIVDVSDENGSVSASLRVPQDYNNRDIIVSVTAGGYESNLNVTTYGTTLDVQGTGKSVVVGGTLDVDFTLTAGDDEPIVNRPIILSSAAGNTITPATPVTDQNGKVSVSIGTEMGLDTISYSALNDPTLTGSFSLDVSSDELAFITAGGASEVSVGQTSTITVEWLSSGAPVVNGPLRVTTTAGEIAGDSILFTDANGHISFPISSPSAGDAKIIVQDATDGAPFSTFDMLFVATVPASLNLSSTSTRVFVDEDRAEITALVRDANGNPVKGQEVTFSADDLRGGQLSPSTGVTNDSGEATTSFIAGSNATEIDAIEIFGRVEGTTIDGSVKLSVVERRLNVTIGAGSGLLQDDLLTQNIKNLVVQVADGSGAPLEGDEFATLSGNGTLLTDSNGTGYFRMIYPKGNSNWAFLRITARAAALGTEAQDDLEISLRSLVADVDDEDVSPPNLTSPYGVSADCASPN